MGRIIIKATADGTSVTTEGFAGEECLRATEGIERRLGKASSVTLTPEFYEGATCALDQEG